MTEDEAKTKWCPFVRTGLTAGRYCIVSGCMMWRWDTYQTSHDPTTVGATSGFCGLAGKEL